MKGSIGTSLQGKMIVVKEKKLSKRQKKRLSKVKGNHKIKTDHLHLDKIAENKRLREERQNQHLKS